MFNVWMLHVHFSGVPCPDRLQVRQVGHLGKHIEVCVSRGTRGKNNLLLQQDSSLFSCLPKSHIKSPDEFNRDDYSWSPYPGKIPRCYPENPSLR